MRDFTFNDTPRTTEAGTNGVRPLLNEEPVLVQRETVAEDAPLRSFHIDKDDDESGSNTAKIVGGIVFGLLVIGGGIYAYEKSSANSPSQTVAMNTPARAPMTAAQPNNPPAVEPPMTATDTTAAPSQASSDGISSAPSRAHIRTVKKADNSNGASAQASAPAPDAAINAPMTVTPETAPLPEQSAPAGQTAMQQPITQPSVTAQMPQPAPEVANNSATSDTQPSNTSQAAQPAETAPAPTDQSAEQPATPAQ